MLVKTSKMVYMNLDAKVLAKILYDVSFLERVAQFEGPSDWKNMSEENPRFRIVDPHDGRVIEVSEVGFIFGPKIEAKE